MLQVDVVVDRTDSRGAVRLSPAALGAVAGTTPARCYARGEMILWAGQGTDSSLLFLGGAARVYRLSDEGKEMTLRILEGGDVLPIASDKDYVEAAADATVVCRVPRRQFFERVMADPRAGMALAEYICSRLVSDDDALEELCFHDVRTRLAHQLAGLARRHGDRLVYTREELGRMVHASRQEICAALALLRDRGWIQYDNHRPREIRVLSVRALERAECHLRNVS